MQTRRQFLQESIAATVAFIVVGCSPSRRRHASRVVPTATTTIDAGGFGGRVDAGPFDALLTSITKSGTPRYVAPARAYVAPYPFEFAERARSVYPADALALLSAGAVVLYQRCTHLGCRVPFCESSQWFECPCHDAKFDRVGENRHGPAPRGMDLMKASIEHGRLAIDTGTILAGLPVGTNTTHQAAEGPFCA